VAAADRGPAPAGGVPRYDAQYSPQARADFYTSCAEQHPQPNYCDCAWAAIRENVPWPEYVRVDDDLFAHPGKSLDDTVLGGYLRPCEAAYPSPRPTVSSSPRRR
jgi:hypothetical protein